MTAFVLGLVQFARPRARCRTDARLDLGLLMLVAQFVLIHQSG